MKIIMVFLAMVVIFAACIVHQTDMNGYVLLQKWLKAAAEEAAAGGVLMIDDSSYVEKRYIIDEEAAASYASFITAPLNNKASIVPLRHGEISCIVSKLSDTQIKADVTWTAKSDFRLFRLPFLRAPSTVTQSSVYEAVE